MKERQRWQPEEDALLKAYVKQYGPKEWNLVSQRMGKPLNRDPKSCLERWKNYLKPGIKKGSLTPEEQSLVISLQAKYGNKWKKIAGEVPGRTAKRLGKWWEVFKEKQLKELQKKKQSRNTDLIISPEASSSTSTISPVVSSTPAGQYDHILETFAEKYVVQPNSTSKFLPATYPTVRLAPIMPPATTISLPDPDPVLSLGSGSSLPLWMNHNRTSTTSSLSSSTSSTTPSPSVSLSLSPGDQPGGLDPNTNRFIPLPGQVGTVLQYCKELEEVRQSWMQQKKEATWRLSRLEQQLEAEKARKKREKMEEIEAKMRCLKEEEMAFLGRIESECKEQLNVLQRDAENKEAKLVEAWCSKHVKLAKIIEQIGFNTTTQSPP